MLGQKLKLTRNKGLPAALFEVGLIFLGITLAIGFENWNTERKERHDELALLAELKSNLEENVVLLAEVIAVNEESVVSFETVLAHIDAGRPYSESLAAHFANLDGWASPYLTSSAYETLKSRGLKLISDSSVRQQIIKLFDVEYVQLAYDYDRVEWINYEISTVPLMLKHFEERSDRAAVPIDYDELLEDRGFRIAARRTLEIRKSGIRRFEKSTEATTQVIFAIAEVTGL